MSRRRISLTGDSLEFDPYLNAKEMVHTLRIVQNVSKLVLKIEFDKTNVCLGGGGLNFEKGS